MNVTFRQLRLFLALADTGSVSAAARALHVTQPTASMQLREVSEAVRGVALNPDHTTIEVMEDAGRLRVVVVYDASDSLIMALGGMLPRPPSVIRRSAVIHVGDY